MKTGNEKGGNRVAVVAHPIISDHEPRDTLDRVADIIELLGQMDSRDGLTPGARAGLQWIHWMLMDTVRHVSDGLSGQEPGRRGRVAVKGKARAV